MLGVSPDAAGGRSCDNTDDKGGRMTQSILVAYATKKGSTQEVAEAIAERLDERGLQTTVQPAGEVTDLTGFDGIVLGGSLYMTRWHADARRFMRRYTEMLATLPLAVFAMGPLTTEERDVEGARKQLDHALAKTPDVTPVSIAIFGGVVDPAKLRFPFNHMPASDARDWDAIREWADEVAELLRAEVPAPA
jgi:menaquinone-dependent protoporphyrinogen oxidase